MTPAKRRELVGNRQLALSSPGRSGSSERAGYVEAVMASASVALTRRPPPGRKSPAREGRCLRHDKPGQHRRRAPVRIQKGDGVRAVKTGVVGYVSTIRTRGALRLEDAFDHEVPNVVPNRVVNVANAQPIRWMRNAREETGRRKRRSPRRQIRMDKLA